MANRTFPFSPASADRLVLGDLLAVPNDDGSWAVLQVSCLRPRTRSAFGVGTLPWRGLAQPTAESIQGLDFLEHALTRIEIFTEGRIEVVGTASLAGGPQSNLLEYGVGTKHKSWGWRAAIEKAQAASVREP